VKAIIVPSKSTCFYSIGWLFERDSGQKVPLVMKVVHFLIQPYPAFDRLDLQFLIVREK
jgi:hypothetical protein